MARGESPSGPRVQEGAVAHDVHDHRIAVVEGVEDVRDVDRVDPHPGDVRVAARPRHDPHPGTGLGHPAVRERPPRGGELEVEQDGEVQEDDPGGGGAEIVHQDGAGDADVLGPDQGPGGVDDVVAEERWAEDVAPEEEEVTGPRVGLRMCTHGRGQCTVEVVHPGATQVVRDQMRESLVGQGEGCPCVADHMGVGRRVDRLAGALRAVGAELGRQGASTHPAVAVAERLSAAEGHGMDHPVAVEPVVLGLVGRHDGWVRPVAQEPPVEIGRDEAGHRQLVVVAAFFEHRRVVSVEVRVDRHRLLAMLSPAMLSAAMLSAAMLPAAMLPAAMVPAGSSGRSDVGGHGAGCRGPHQPGSGCVRCQGECDGSGPASRPPRRGRLTR